MPTRRVALLLRQHVPAIRISLITHALVKTMSSDNGGVVTLIFYRIGSGFEVFNEPFLNLIAAGFQLSAFTHVEIAIGNEAGAMGQMSNVCRIFNDDVGVVSDAQFVSRPTLALKLSPSRLDGTCSLVVTALRSLRRGQVAIRNTLICRLVAQRLVSREC